MPQATALAISGDPLTRPPISSVRRRRFSSMGEGPITWGTIFAAACAQLEASVAEQAAALCADWAGTKESFAGGSCAATESETAKQRTNEAKKNLKRRIGILSLTRLHCSHPTQATSPCILAPSSISSRRFAEKLCGTNQQVERIRDEKIDFDVCNDSGARCRGPHAIVRAIRSSEPGCPREGGLGDHSRNAQCAWPPAGRARAARSVGRGAHLRAERA